MNKIVATVVIASGWLGGFAGAAFGQKPPLLPEKDVAELANELSGETAERNLEVLATFHRQRGSKGFHAAAELVTSRLREYGLSDVEILQFPADGKIFYGTQRSRPGWDAEIGEVEEVKEVKQIKETGVLAAATGVRWEVVRKIGSYAAEPVVLAEDSESADVRAELADVGEGLKESDYAGKDVKGKIVMVGAQPGAVQDLAVGKFGAAGIVSYAQNQKTAWWGEDENLIRWGHLETFSANRTFAFMVSLKAARGFRERLGRGERITLHALVKAGQYAGNYEVVTAVIPGADAKLKEEEMAFSCHLDHQRPGANDNASGCVTILEVARTVNKLISEGKLARPARTIRFIFPPEIEGTLAMLNSAYDRVHPLKLTKNSTKVLENGEVFIEHVDYKGGTAFLPYYKRIKAVVHMDMVGGGPATEAVFHVTRGPISLPSFVHDVAWAFAEFVNEESYKFAATGKAEYPMLAPQGGKEPLRAEYSAYTMGSDHDVYQDSSFGIPAIYLNDWPDRYIHTNFDTAANIDPTKLKRAAFIGAASGYFLAGMNTYNDYAHLNLESGEILWTHDALRRIRSVSSSDQENLIWALNEYKAGLGPVLSSWFPGDSSHWMIRDDVGGWFQIAKDAVQRHDAKRPTSDGALRLSRKSQPKGPLAVFGYDYFAEHAKAAGVATPKLPSYEGLWGSGEEYAYEVLNFADGKRNAQEIRDAVSAEYGPVPLEMVVEYLRALEKIGLVSEVK